MDLISDIHLEFDSKWKLPKPIETDRILIIAGDLCPIATFSKHFSDFIATASTFYRNVIFIAGNHEYYSVMVNG